MQHVDCLELVLTTKIFSHVLYGSSRQDKIHTFPSSVERGLEIQEVYFCFSLLGYFPNIITQYLKFQSGGWVEFIGQNSQ